MGGGREIKRLESYLWEGERVERMTTGAYGKGTGLIVLTDRRLLFVQDGMMSQTTEDFPLEHVTSVSWASGLLGTVVIYTAGNKAEIKNVHKGDGKEIVDLVRHRLSEGTAAQQQPAPQQAPGNDVTSQLAKLGELRDAGVINDQEFQAKKADLLNRM